MSKVSFTAVAALAVILSAGLAQADTGLNTKRVVHDSSGDVVTAIGDGSCVRTTSVGDTDGCSREVMVNTSRTVLSDKERVVYFDFNKATLTPEAKHNLDAVAARLQQASDVKSATIVGYADRIGTDAYNVALSQRRAEAVKAYLVKHGYMNVNVAEVRALGESQPVTHCADSLPHAQKVACLAPDRRVELELVYTTEMVTEHSVRVPSAK